VEERRLLFTTAAVATNVVVIDTRSFENELTLVTGKITWVLCITSQMTRKHWSLQIEN